MDIVALEHGGTYSTSNYQPGSVLVAAIATTYMEASLGRLPCKYRACTDGPHDQVWSIHFIPHCYQTPHPEWIVNYEWCRMCSKSHGVM